jgi:hypothetical protein
MRKTKNKLNSLIKKIALTAAISFSVSCGQEKKKQNPDYNTGKKTNAENATAKATTPEKNSQDKVVDPDAFSQAFSNAKYHFDPDGTKQKKPLISPGDFFDKGELAVDKFKNDDYKNVKPPKKKLAAKISTGERFSWLPKWDYAKGGGVNIPDAKLSSDDSLLAILENIKGKKGGTATLLVLVDTYSWRPAQIHFFQNKTLSKLLFLDNEKRAALWENLQDGGGRIHIVNLATGKLEKSSDKITAKLESAITSNDGKKIYLNLDSPKKHILAFDTDNIANPPTFLEAEQRHGILALSQDGKFIALAGPEKIELIKIADGKKIKEMKSPLDKTPDAFAFLEDPAKMALLAYMKPCYITASGKSEKLRIQSGKHLEYLPKTKRLVIEEFKNNRVSIIDIKTLKEISHFDPGRTKPRTTGTPIIVAYLAQQDKYLELDTMGNLCLFRLPGKKWKKEIIFSAEK